MQHSAHTAQAQLFTDRFESCRHVMTAMGDETRQLILKLLIERRGEGGLRGGDIRKNTNISRAAVSHHLKVLLDAGLVQYQKRGTMNFYYPDTQSGSLKNLIAFWNQADALMGICPIGKKESIT